MGVVTALEVLKDLKKTSRHSTWLGKMVLLSDIGCESKDEAPFSSVKGLSTCETEVEDDCSV